MIPDGFRYPFTRNVQPGGARRIGSIWRPHLFGNLPPSTLREPNIPAKHPKWYKILFVLLVLAAVAFLVAFSVLSAKYGDTIRDKDECVPNPCGKNGDCVDLINGFWCECANHFTGTVCETEILGCDSYPCLNNGDCANLPDGEFRCACPALYTGAICENIVDSCQASPCIHGSCNRLNPEIGHYQCLCESGWYGDHCDEVVDECGSIPCLAGGTCSDLVNGYTCTCPPGYTGVICEVEIDECDTVTCVNSTCQDSVNGYECVCNPGYTGYGCTTVVDNCVLDSCPDQEETLPIGGGGQTKTVKIIGTCITSGHSYYCDCILTSINGGLPAPTDIKFNAKDCEPKV